MRAIAAFVLLTVWRDRWFSALLLALCAAAGLAAFLGGNALVEGAEMGTVVTAWLCRGVLSLGLLVGICFCLRQMADARELDVWFTRALPRWQIIGGLFLGFAVVAALLALPVALAAGGLAAGVGQAGAGTIGTPAWWLWLASLLMESWMVIGIALFCGLTLRSAASAVLAGSGLYLFGRLSGYLAMTADTVQLSTLGWLNEVVRGTFLAISALMPRLDLFAPSTWLVYGLGQGTTLTATLMPLLWQTLIYVPLLLVAALLDTYHKEY